MYVFVQLCDFKVMFGKVSLPARTVHNRALIDKLICHDIYVSAVFVGTSTSFAHHVDLDAASSKLVALDWFRFLIINLPKHCLLLVFGESL